MRYPNEGARLLKLLMERDQLTQGDVYRRLEITDDGSVSRHLSGERTPTLERALLYEKHLEIPPKAWKTPATRRRS